MQTFNQLLRDGCHVYDLSEETIKRIVHQLEEKCRDVEPASIVTERG